MSQKPHVWKPSQAGGTPPPGAGKSWKVIGLTAALLALAGGVLAWLLFPNPFTPPRFLSLAVHDYPGLPPLAWARQDADAIGAVGWSKSQGGQNSQELPLLRSQLEGLASHPPGVPVVVLLSGYVVEHQGKPHLLPAPQLQGKAHLRPVDAILGRPDGWLPLEDALRAVRLCPARHKLLLLDVMRPLILPERGLVRGETPAGLWAMLEASVNEDPRLTILTACSPGQVPLASEELGQGVFGHFVARGLHGVADGWMPGKRADGRVSLIELAEYARLAVDHWAMKSLGQRQTPKLLGSKDDFPLTLAEASASQPEPLGERPDWLDKEWKTLDGWRDKGVVPAVRRPFRERMKALAEAEARWRGGGDPRDVRPVLEGRLREPTEEYRKNALVAPEPGLARMTPPKEAAVDSMRRLLAGRDKLPAKPDAEMLKPFLAGAEALSKEYKEKPAELALLAVVAAEGQAFGPEAARFLESVLNTVPGVDRFGECAFLMRLCRRADKVAIWSPLAAQLAVQAVAEESRVRAFSDEVMKWSNVPGSADATKPLLEGEAPWDKAVPALKTLVARYQVERSVLKDVDAAISARDEALAVLPAMLMSNDALPAPVSSLERATGAALRLSELLADVPVARAARLGELREAAGTLRQGPDSLQALSASLDGAAFRSLIERMKKGQTVDIEQGRAWLSSARPATRQRLALWVAIREGTRLRADAGMEALGSPGTPRAPIPDIPEWDEASARRATTTSQARDVDRARAAVLRLRLATGGGLSAADDLLGALSRRPGDGAAWQKLAAVLKKAGG